jgi:hypothetical protein
VIARQYLSSWFMVDAVSALPLTLLQLDPRDSLMLLKMLRLARLFKVLPSWH